MIGRTLAHFRILEKIGEGGMGVVYRAEDENLRRPVALKVLPPDLVGDEERRLRFLREARAAAAVTHPNIAVVHEVGEADGIVFIAMEHIEGRTLRSLIGGRPVPIKEALGLARQVAEGVARAHASGVIHRDLKPDNIMVTPEGHAKILDFGLAKLLEEPLRGADAETSRLQTISGDKTREGKVLGTVAYMSPEQARGRPVDARSDIFSFGIVLYEMLTGRPPFQGGTGLDTMSAIIQKDPIPATQVVPGLPPKLDDVLGKCLEKDPADRYQHADELAVDLRQLLRASESGAQTVSAARPAPGAPATGKRLVIAAGIAGAVVAALGILYAFDLGGLRTRFAGQGTAGRIESIAVLPLTNMSRDPDQEFFSDGMTEALISDLAKIKALRIISRTSAMRYKGTDKPLQQIAREIGVDAVVEGSVMRSGDRVRITAQLIEAATDRHVWAESYERDMRDVLGLQGEVARTIAREIRITLTPEEHARLADRRTVDRAVYEAYLKGRYQWTQRTEAGLRKGLEYFKEAIHKDPMYAPAYSGLADSYYVLAAWGYEAPLTAGPRARAAAEKALEIDGDLSEGHSSLASILADFDWKRDEAEKEFRSALRLNPGNVQASYWYAMFLAEGGLVDEAIAEAGRAASLDPLSSAAASMVGMCQFFARRYDEAIEAAEKAIEIDPDFFWPHSLLGDAYAMQGRWKESIAAHRHAVELSVGSSTLYGSLGYALARGGQAAEARDLLERFRNGSLGGYGAPTAAAQILVGLGEHESAFRELERAAEMRDRDLVWINASPYYDPLRADPRFQSLLRRLGFGS